MLVQLLVHFQKTIIPSSQMELNREFLWLSPKILRKHSLAKFGQTMLPTLTSSLLKELSGGNQISMKCIRKSNLMVFGLTWMRYQISVSAHAIRDNRLQTLSEISLDMCPQEEISRFKVCHLTVLKEMETFHLILTHFMEYKRSRSLMNGSNRENSVLLSLREVHLQEWVNMVQDGLEIISHKPNSWSFQFQERCSWICSVFH